MMTAIFVKPSATARVRQPERNSAVMPAEGGWISRSVHYEGLIQSGDLIVVDPQPSLPKAEQPAPQKTDIEPTVEKSPRR